MVILEKVDESRSANDAAAITALDAPDAAMYLPDQTKWRGRAAIQKGDEAMLKDMKVVEQKPASAGMETFGDKSIGWGHYTISSRQGWRRPRSSRPPHGPGKEDQGEAGSSSPTTPLCRRSAAAPAKK